MNRMGFLVCGFTPKYNVVVFLQRHAFLENMQEKGNPPLRNLGVIFNCDSMSISKTVVWYAIGISG